jgi:predicted PurR-regulated permease PerM
LPFELCLYFIIQSTPNQTICAIIEAMIKPIVKYIFENHVLATVIIVAIAIFLFQIRGILLGLFMAYIIVASVYPFVQALEKRQVPKILAITLIYALVIAFVVLLVIPMLPFLGEQIQALFKAIPIYVDNVSRIFGFNLNLSQVQDNLTPVVSALGENAFNITSRVFGGIFSVLTIFVISFYMLVEKEKLEKSIPSLLPKPYAEKTRNTLLLVEDKLGAWLRGQIVLSFSIGIITWIALTLLGIPFALPLAILAGIFEIVPTIGPIIAAVPAVIVAFSISPIMGLVVMLLYVGIQVAENNLLVPKIMQKAVGLNPVVILISILIGSQLFGIIGALLSIPFVSAMIIIIRSLK